MASLPASNTTSAMGLSEHHTKHDGGGDNDSDSYSSPPSETIATVSPPSPTLSVGSSTSTVPPEFCLSPGVEKTIEQVVEVIRKRFDNEPVGEHTFVLGSQQAYEALYARLGEDPELLAFYEDEVRKDWDEHDGVLTLLMPCYIHDHTAFYSTLKIDKGLERLAERYPALLPIYEQIRMLATAPVKRRGRQDVPTFDAEPDGSFRYLQVRYPTLIIEVAYSQAEKALTTKNERWHRTFPGISTLTIDIEYAPPEIRDREEHCHSATVALHTSELDEDGFLLISEVQDAETFRDKNGLAVAGELLIPFELFVPRSMHDTLPGCAREAIVKISFAELASILAEAEKEQRMLETESSPQPECKGIRKRDKHGNVTSETLFAPTPRQQRSQANLTAQTELQPGRTRSQTRAASEGRKSGRLAAASGKR